MSKKRLNLTMPSILGAVGKDAERSETAGHRAHISDSPKPPVAPVSPIPPAAPIPPVAAQTAGAGIASTATSPKIKTNDKSKTSFSIDNQIMEKLKDYCWSTGNEQSSVVEKAISDLLNGKTIPRRPNSKARD